MAEKNKKRKKSLFIVTTIIILVVLAVIASSIFARKNLDDLKGILSNLNPFAQGERAGEGGGAGEGESGTGEPTTTIANKSKNETIIGRGGVNPAETGEGVTYGSGFLKIINSIHYSDYGGSVMAIIHNAGYSENYVEEEDMLYAGSPFSPSGIQSKVISKTEGYELKTDKRPTASLSTIYLELSMHSQSGDAITINSTNELKFSFVSSTGIGDFDDFTNKFITLQQYNPNNTAESFPAYDVRTVIEEDNGVIPLARLDGSYNSEEPYAYFRLSFG